MIIDTRHDGYMQPDYENNFDLYGDDYEGPDAADWADWAEQTFDPDRSYPFTSTVALCAPRLIDPWERYDIAAQLPPSLPF